jgi:hypothetical protein
VAGRGCESTSELERGASHSPFGAADDRLGDPGALGKLRLRQTSRDASDAQLVSKSTEEPACSNRALGARQLSQIPHGPTLNPGAVPSAQQLLSPLDYCTGTGKRRGRFSVTAAVLGGLSERRNDGLSAGAVPQRTTGEGLQGRTGQGGGRGLRR